MKPEIYISADIEADGRILGISSMLSFGSAAYTEGKELVSTFSANLHQLPNTQPDNGVYMILILVSLALARLYAKGVEVTSAWIRWCFSFNMFCVNEII